MDYALLILITIYLVFRLTSPYIFTNASWLDISLSKTFMDSLNFQRSAITGEIIFPPSWQWFETTPYLFPLKNILIWGLGLPIGISAIGGLGYFIYEQFLYLKHHYHLKQLITPLTSPLLIAFILSLIHILSEADVLHNNLPSIEALPVVILAKLLRKPIVTTYAVSYTHLDVYKRQAFTHCVLPPLFVKGILLSIPMIFPFRS